MRAAERVVESAGFHRAVAVAIVSCSLLVGVERLPVARALPETLFFSLDWIFGAFFFVEIVLRIMADGPLRFLRFLRRSEHGLHLDEHGFWNVFDLGIVTVSFMTLAAHVLAHPEFLFVARLARIFRVLRLLEVSRQLRVIETRIAAVIPTVFAFIMLLAILIYIYAVLASHLFDEVPAFASVDAAFLTMFQVLTLDNWSDVMHLCTPIHPTLAPVFFVSFILLTAIVSLNVFIAALSHQMEIEMAATEAAAPELLQLEQRILAEIKALRAEVAGRGDGKDA